jgi:hypothetical protein
MTTYRPPRAMLRLTGRAFRRAVSDVEIMQLSKLPGVSIGSCTVQYSRESAADFDPEIGKLADVFIGGRKVFSGVVAAAPVDIDPDDDVARLVLSDVKSLLRGVFIGQPGYGDGIAADAGAHDADQLVRRESVAELPVADDARAGGGIRRRLGDVGPAA